MLIRPDRHIACRVQDYRFHIVYFTVPKRSIALGLKLPVIEEIDNNKFNYIGDTTILMNSETDLFEVFLVENPPCGDPIVVDGLFEKSFLDIIPTELNI